MRGLLHTSLPGISQEALPAPYHCFFPQVQHSGPPCMEAGDAGPPGRTTIPRIPVSVGKEPCWSQCTQLHAGRTRAISSRGGAAAIKMAVYCSRAQFSQDCAFHSFPLQSQQAPAQCKCCLKRDTSLVNEIQNNLKELEQLPESDTGWETHTPFSLLKLHACNDKMLPVRL